MVRCGVQPRRRGKMGVQDETVFLSDLEVKFTVSFKERQGEVIAYAFQDVCNVGKDYDDYLPTVCIMLMDNVLVYIAGWAVKNSIEQISM